MKNTTAEAKKMVEAIIEAIAAKPEIFEVRVNEGEKVAIFEIVPKENNPTEIGKIIGRKGRIARAIKTLVSAAGTKQDKKFILEINDK